MGSRFGRSRVPQALRPLRVAETRGLEALPKALRGLFERERKLLGLLPQCAFRAVRLLYEEHFDRRDALPGMVASIQTFGSALNFNPHVHTLVTEGVLEHGGAFLPLTSARSRSSSAAWCWPRW